MEIVYYQEGVDQLNWLSFDALNKDDCLMIDFKPFEFLAGSSHSDQSLYFLWLFKSSKLFLWWGCLRQFTEALEALNP